MKENLSVWATRFLFAVAVIAVYKTFDSFPDLLRWLQSVLRLLRPFFYGLVTAFLLLPPARKLEGLLNRIGQPGLKKRARGISVVSSLIGFVLLLLLAMFWFVPALYKSLSGFVTALPGYLGQLYQLAEEAFGKEPWISGLVNQLSEKFTFASILEWIGALNLSGYAAGLSTLLGQLVDLFLGMVLSIYILIDRASIRKNLLRMIRLFCKKQTVAELTLLTARIGNVLYSFLYGQAMDALFVGVASWLGFSLLQIPNAPMLGFFYGLFSLIPYFGAFIGVFTVGIFSLISGGVGKFIVAMVFILVLQQIDGNIINPKIIGNSIGIRPLYVIFGATFFGGLFGIAGMLLGPPLVAIAGELCDGFIRRREAALPQEEPDSAGAPVSEEIESQPFPGKKL